MKRDSSLREPTVPRERDGEEKVGLLQNDEFTDWRAERGNLTDAGKWRAGGLIALTLYPAGPIVLGALRVSPAQT
jgi:hypothetical protein